MIDHATWFEYRAAYDRGERNNVQTGLMAQYEAVKFRPQCIVAYIGKTIGDGMGVERHGATSRREVTTWTGDRIGIAAATSSWRVHSYVGNRMYQYIARIGGADYMGRGFGNGMSIVLKRKA